jgi:ATPase subunit of ABC transporter with duplicated ATPase domains
VLFVEKLSKSGFFTNVSFTLRKGDKVAFISPDSSIITTLFNTLMRIETADSGSFKYGITTTPSYFSQDYEKLFKTSDNLVDWLRPYSKDQADSYLRGWLGRMLFSGEEALKQARVLSGGEKARCMFAKMMLTAGNVLLMDEPTNHLDLEAITALNKGLQNYRGVLLFTSHDHELVATVANRIIYVDENVFIDKKMTYDEFIEWTEIHPLTF